MSHIDTLYQMGDDALGNQFEVSFSALSLFDALDSLKMRTTNVDIPEYSVSTYTVEHKTQSMVKVGGKITTPKEITLTLRVDKYWGLYNAIKDWLKYIGGEETGQMAEDNILGGESSFRTDFTVYTLDSNDTPTGGGWKFHKACPTNISSVGLDYSSGDPITVSITFSFLKMTDII